MRISKKHILLLVAIIGCIAGIVVLHMRVALVRSEIALRQEKIDAAPQELQQIVQMKKDLVSAQGRVASLQRMTVHRDGLPEAVTAIAQAASDAGVAAQVPEVSQNSKQEKSEADSLEDVRIHISASGRHVQLLNFLYRIEQLPYLLHIASWNIDTTHQVALNFFAAVPTTSSLPQTVLGSSLEVDLIITILK
ncbi:MAG: hypothetical protein A3E36_03745 [Candidatus Andersenbacteria bacterium RIFCSPHIGHO2_12_FULL_45_11b]|uniref:Type 4a pilus biogenesis protein PilO n=1 Tax=Candidatus Andersenbacteria bacterium RIFCSPHIGHO2_12_FULL_45_11b TaxID=1797282 RepID=A0A1G1XA73_9BACT|nr:MAG: hypothetical protein A3E36_03745 [Candidatus Andersenbacteria bacterium RIFCSPHIGHO2_12_FULL_45_11b]